MRIEEKRKYHRSAGISRHTSWHRLGTAAGIAGMLLSLVSCSSDRLPLTPSLDHTSFDNHDTSPFAQEDQRASPSTNQVTSNLYQQMLQQGNYSDAAVFQSLQEFKPQPSISTRTFENRNSPSNLALVPDPDFPATTESSLGANWHTKVGWTFVLDGNYPAAEAAYRQALRHEIESAEAYLGLGMALMFQGKREEAILAYEKALKIHPSYAAALVHLGYAYADKATEEPDSRAKARLLFQQASDLGDPFALLALMGLKDKEEGI